MTKEQEQIEEIKSLFTAPYVSSVLIDNIKSILEITEEDNYCLFDDEV